MDLMDLLVKAGGKNSVGQLADAVGLGEAEASSMDGALAPALMRGLQKQTESPSGVAGLQKALTSGHHRQYIEQPELMQSAATRDDGNRILGHLFGGKDVSRNVAAEAAQQTGVDAGIIKKALPLLAGLAMGALSKETDHGATVGDSSGGLLGSVLGGLLGGNNNQKGGLDDVLNLAKKLF